MKAKTLILLFVALGCGMIAAVAVSKAVMTNQNGSAEEAMVEIIVAAKDMQQGEQISAEDVKLEQWPKARLPEGAVFDLSLIEDKFTKQSIFLGEPILERKVNDTSESLSTTVPPGFRIFDIKSDANYIKPGDHVDILGTFHPGGHNTPPESRTVMRNIKVHGTNGSSTRDDESEDGPRSINRGTMFQLLVKESQLEALTLADSMGTLQLNLRPFDEDREQFEDDGAEFMTWARQSASTDDDQPTRQIPVFNLTPSNLEDQDPGAQAMIIVTPNGIRRYEWTDENPLPQEVLPESESTEPYRGPVPPNYSGPSGNVYSGYGGYSPTYPTSTDAPVEGEEERFESNGEGAEGK
jgi:pilus assembly protein CpaB